MRLPFLRPDPPERPPDELRELQRRAIREGIASRLLELGFKRKSERRYEREDDAYKFWTHFSLRQDGTFGELTGVLAKDFDQTIKASGIRFNGYATDSPAPAHVFLSSRAYWAEQSRKAYVAFQGRYRWLGPIAWFVPWMEIHDWRHPYERSPFASDKGWDPQDDWRGCAEASLDKWREIVAPWLDRMTDKRAFALWYSTENRQHNDPICRAAAHARAGDANKARTILAWHAANGGKSIAQEKQALTDANIIGATPTTDVELTASAKRLNRYRKKYAEEALAMAHLLEISLDLAEPRAPTA